MKVYMVTFDGQSRVVEASSFGEAVKVWLEGMREPWGDDWIGDEEPEQVVLLGDEPAIRALGNGRCCLLERERVLGLLRPVLAEAETGDDVRSSLGDTITSIERGDVP